MLDKYINYKLLLGLSIFGITQSYANGSNNFAASYQGQWMNSDELQPGMKVLTADKKLVTVVNSWVLQESNQTFNVSVADSKTYFIGEEKIWVHNTGDCEKNWLQRWIDSRIQNQRARVGKTQPNNQLPAANENPPYGHQEGSVLRVAQTRQMPGFTQEAKVLRDIHIEVDYYSKLTQTTSGPSYEISFKINPGDTVNPRHWQSYQQQLQGLVDSNAVSRVTLQHNVDGKVQTIIFENSSGAGYR